jgi:hypothetical protein
MTPGLPYDAKALKRKSVVGRHAYSSLTSCRVVSKCPLEYVMTDPHMDSRRLCKVNGEGERELVYQLSSGSDSHVDRYSELSPKRFLLRHFTQKLAE